VLRSSHFNVSITVPSGLSCCMSRSYFVHSSAHSSASNQDIYLLGWMCASSLKPAIALIHATLDGISMRRRGEGGEEEVVSLWLYSRCVQGIDSSGTRRHIVIDNSPRSYCYTLSIGRDIYSEYSQYCSSFRS
jgi:hypothetical protein